MICYNIYVRSITSGDVFAFFAGGCTRGWIWALLPLDGAWPTAAGGAIAGAAAYDWEFLSVVRVSKKFWSQPSFLVFLKHLCFLLMLLEHTFCRYSWLVVSMVRGVVGAALLHENLIQESCMISTCLSWNTKPLFLMVGTIQLLLCLCLSVAWGLWKNRYGQSSSLPNVNFLSRMSKKAWISALSWEISIWKAPDNNRTEVNRHMWVQCLCTIERELVQAS